MVVRRQFVKGQAAGNGDGPRGRPHCAIDEPRFVRFGVGKIIRRAAGDGGGFPIDAPRFGSQVVLAQHQGGCAEGVGLDDVGAGGQVFAVNVLDDVRTGHVEVLVAALVLVSAEVVRPQPARLNLRTHGPVGDQNTPVKQRFQIVDAFSSVHKLNAICTVFHNQGYPH